jgi:GntR family transcriptional regulator/MocR family aminotransferase
VTTANICVTQGHQEAIFLTARTLLQQGDHVAVEYPGYQPACHAFTMAGAQLHPIPVDHAGISIEHLEKLCEKQTLKALYITPHHQYPTTVTLSAERRKQLVELSELYHFMIIEDDYDHEYHFSNERILPVAGMQQLGNVIYIGTLSNELPLAFVCGPVAFAHSLAACYAVIHQQENSILELAVANLLASGEIRKHQQQARTIYQQKMELAAGIIPFTKPSGGLALWLELPFVSTPAKVLQKIQAEGINIANPVRYYDPLYNGAMGIRLGYASLEETEIVRGLEKLERILR